VHQHEDEIERPEALEIYYRTAVEGDSLVLHYYRDATLTDIHYIIESSDSLSTWTEIYSSEDEVFESGPAKYTDTANLSALDHRFLRLRIERL